MVSIDWPVVMGVLLTLLGGLGTAGGGAWWWFKRAKTPVSPKPATVPVVTRFTNTVDTEPVSDVRGADDPAPPGAVAWVQDIVAAMGAAKADSILPALVAGESRDIARARRIGELEGKKAASPVSDEKAKVTL